MRLRLAGLTALTLALLPLTACSDDSEPTVAAAFYPLAWASERVAGDHYAVENLTQPGAEPHDLEVDVATTAKLTDADLVVFERDFQPAIDQSIEENAEGETLDAADVIELQPFAEHDDEAHAEDDHADDHADEEQTDDDHAHDEGSEDHADEGTTDDHSDDHAHEEESGDGHDHDHGDVDPHFWQDPLLMADLSDAIADRLAEIDSDNADDYRDNAAELRGELEALDQEYADGLANCDRDTVVVSHDAFGYLARYGLHLEPIAGLSPDAEPTPAELAELKTLVDDEGVTTVFSERLASPKLAETLADEAGVETAVLDPIEGLTDETSDDDYLSLMRQNLDALKEANGC